MLYLLSSFSPVPSLIDDNRRPSVDRRRRRCRDSFDRPRRRLVRRVRATVFEIRWPVFDAGAECGLYVRSGPERLLHSPEKRVEQRAEHEDAND